MARAQVPFYSLNSGEIDKATVNRIDLEKMRMAADKMVNFMPLVRGPMTMRPGTTYVGQTKGSGKARLMPFVFNASTTSLVEFTGSTIRIWNDNALVSYPAYSTVVTNGSFDAALGSGWSNVSSNGASVAISGGDLAMYSTNYSYARAMQTVTIASADQAKLHCLKIEVRTGPVTFRIGRTAGGREVVDNQVIDTGTHFIAFTPNVGTIYLEFEANEKYRGERRVASCTFVSNQTLELPSPYALSDINNIRSAQSGSVIFLACKGYKQYKLERRGPNSWGIAEYKSIAGPYLPYSGSKIRIKASDTKGNVTITSNQPLFDPGMVGSVWEMTTTGQRRTEVFTGNNQSTGYIKVTGVGGKSGGSRAFTYSLSYADGATGTVRVEWSYGLPDSWANAYGQYTTESAFYSGTFTVNDGVLYGETENGVWYSYESNDNVIVYYRITTTASNSTGTITAAVNYAGGSQTGVFRITGYTNSTTVTAEVLDELGAANKWTDDWREGAWSDYRTWPTSVALHDGRLWWAGLDKVWGSVSDDYTNFNPTTEGDAAPINRSVALGPVEGISWMLSTQRLMVGTASSEVSIRSNSIEEPITPAKFTARNASTLGSANIQAVTVDSAGIFVQRAGTKVFQLLYDAQINDYSPSELTRINQTICEPGVVSIAVQRQPDTRIFFVKEDGTIAMLLYDKEEGVAGWSRIETDGEFESICALPSGEDDDVYVVVKRTINGIEQRYIERFAATSEMGGGNAFYLMDSIVSWLSATPTTTITGLSHLAGKEVCVLAMLGAFEDDSFQDDTFQNDASVIVQRYTVSSTGTITLSSPLTAAVIGLPYTAQFRSVKLAYGSQAGTALTQKKRVNHLGIVGINVALDGLRIGRDFDNMTKLSPTHKGKPVGVFEVFEDWDYDATAFGGKYDSDARVCIENVSPYPATISGIVINMESNDRG